LCCQLPFCTLVRLKLLYRFVLMLTLPPPQLQLPHIALPTATPTAKENSMAPGT
jgi:hypothetical protein